MSTSTLHIKDVNNNTQSWAVRIMVEAKTEPRRSASGSKRYQRLQLVDETGQKISATIFDPDINKFKDMFCLYKTYTVSNANVSKIEAKYDKFGYPYQWIINAKTACNADPEHGIMRSLVKNEYASFIDLKSLVGQNVLVDVLGIVIQKRGPKPFIKDGKDYILREFAIINQEKKVIILTLWNAIALAEGDLIDKSSDGFPIIRATRLSISPYYDGSLGSTPSTVIELDPCSPEAHALKTWRSNNLKFIVETIAAKDHFQRIESSSVFSTEDILLIADVVAEEKVNMVAVEVRAKVTNNEQKFYYIACQKCFSAVNAALDYRYTCAVCGELTQAKPRERIFLNIYDDSGSLDVTAFGGPATKIMQVDSEMYLQLSNAGKPVTAEWINKKISDKTYFMNIKRRETQRAGTMQQQYTVVSLRLKESDTDTTIIESQPSDAVNTSQEVPQFKHSVAKELFPDCGESSSEKHDHPGTFDSSA